MAKIKINTSLEPGLWHRVRAYAEMRGGLRINWIVSQSVKFYLDAKEHNGTVGKLNIEEVEDVSGRTADKPPRKL